MAGTRGMKMNAGMVPSHMNAVVITGVAPTLYVMKYASAAFPMLIIANAVMKKNASTLRGRLRRNSIQRSLTLTSSDAFSSITTLSLHCEKEKTRRASPANENMAIVMNHADADSGLSMMALPSAAIGAKMAITIGSDFTISAPKFAMNILVEVRIVISSVSLVRDELSAPYGTFTNV